MDVKNFSADKIFGRMFRKVDNVVWDLMTGKLGIRTRDGEIATLDSTETDNTVSINPFDNFGVVLPAFAQSTPLAEVKVGDLIYSSGSEPGWIIELPSDTRKSFCIMKVSGTISNWIPPKTQMLGIDSGVLVVRTLGNILPGGDAGLAGLQSSILPLLMMGGDRMDLDKIMPLMLLSGTSGGAGGNNMIQLMMMSHLMGGKSGKTPFEL